MDGLIATFILLCAFTVWILQDAPRVLFDYQHADEFVAAKDLKITDAKCKTWNFFLFNECTITFQSPDRKRPSELVEWKFGRAPTGAVHMLKWRDDPSVVTTDMSLDTVGKRLTFVVALAAAGLMFAVMLVAKVVQRLQGRYQAE